MIAFSCPTCQFQLTRHDNEAGSKIPCPSCDQWLEVPQRVPDERAPGEVWINDVNAILVEPLVAPSEKIRCVCPHCRVSIKAGLSKAGATVKCPKCKLPFEVPIPNRGITVEAELVPVDPLQYASSHAGLALPSEKLPKSTSLFSVLGLVLAGSVICFFVVGILTVILVAVGARRQAEEKQQKLALEKESADRVQFEKEVQISWKNTLATFEKDFRQSTDRIAVQYKEYIDALDRIEQRGSKGDLWLAALKADVLAFEYKRQLRLIRAIMECYEKLAKLVDRSFDDFDFDYLTEQRKYWESQLPGVEDSIRIYEKSRDGWKDLEQRTP